ncbi:MAG: ATP-binding protein, partial [Acidimicrobiales bacterium]
MGGDNNGIVGRDPEIARLRGALDAARAGRPAVALVVGPPGIGKTALWRTVLDPQAGGGADDGVVVTATG